MNSRCFASNTGCRVSPADSPAQESCLPACPPTFVTVDCLSGETAKTLRCQPRGRMASLAAHQVRLVAPQGLERSRNGRGLGAIRWPFADSKFGLLFCLRMNLQIIGSILDRIRLDIL